MNLGQRVEHGARRFVKLDRTPDVERPVQRVLGPHQVAEADTNLSERGQCDGQPVARTVCFVQRDAALGERQCLLVAVLQHHDVRLIAADRGQDIVRLDDRGQPFGLAQRRHGFVVVAELRQRNARERMDQRQMTPITGGVQRRRGFRDVLADDRDVADLAIALAQLVVRETDATRVVGRVGLFQGAAVHCDRTRLIAARRRKAAVQPPQGCQAPGRNGVAERIGWAAERGRGLIEVVLEQRRLGHHRPQGELVVARQ